MKVNTTINWIITIVERGKGDRVARFLESEQIPIMLMTHGHGTASSKMMDYLGLDEPEKDILVGMATGTISADILAQLNHLIKFCHPGHGIAFTLPLSSISKGAASRIQHGIQLAAQNNPEKENDVMSESKKNNDVKGSSMDESNPAAPPSDDSTKFELIVTVINSGNSDMVMDAAKSAGCSGGTILKGRSAHSEEIKKVFGLNMPQEKEIITILASSEQKMPIMKAICNTVLQKTGEHATVFSLPVSDAKGISTTL